MNIYAYAAEKMQRVATRKIDEAVGKVLSGCKPGDGLSSENGKENHTSTENAPAEESEAVRGEAKARQRRCQTTLQTLPARDGAIFAETYALCCETMMTESVAEEKTGVVFPDLQRALKNTQAGKSRYPKLLKNLLMMSAENHLSLSMPFSVPFPR